MLDLRTTLNIMQAKKGKNPKPASQKAAKRQEQADLFVENRFRLGACSQKYAASLADPFYGPPDACLPVTPTLNSRKVRTFVRSFGTIGTNGAGFVVMQPLAASDGSAAGVGTAAAYNTGPTYAGTISTGLPILNPATAGITALNHNGDYLQSAFGQTLQCRLVSMGFRIRWSGTELNRGGRVIVYENEDHVNFGSSGMSLVQVLGNERAREFPLSNDWTTLCMSGPVQPSEYEFLASPYFPYGSAGNSAHYMIGLINGLAGSTYDCEFFWNWEFIGSNVRGKTRSDADDVGVSTVLGAIQSSTNGQIDSAHPALRSKDGSVNLTVLGSMVNRYAAKNNSGWVAKTMDYGRKALPYIKSGIEIFKDVAPALEGAL